MLSMTATSIVPDDEREMPTTEEWRAEMRAARKAQGLTQVALAKLCKTTQPTISSVEKGTTGSSAVIMAICRVLKIRPPSFFESDFEKRWRDAGTQLRRINESLFDSLLSAAEAGAIAQPPKNKKTH